MNDQEYIHFFLNINNNYITHTNNYNLIDLYNCYLYLENEYYDKLY